MSSQFYSKSTVGYKASILYSFLFIQVKISDPAEEVLEDVCKGKPRVQKAPKPLKPPSTPGSEKKSRVQLFSSFKIPKLRSSKKSKSKEEEEMEMKEGLLDGKED